VRGYRFVLAGKRARVVIWRDKFDSIFEIIFRGEKDV
jgi:hypothetical protein